MFSFLKPFKWALNNIKDTLKLAYSVDKKLMIIYLLISIVGALTPLAAAFIFKIFLDLTITKSELAGSAPSLPLIIISALAGYFFVKIFYSIVFVGLGESYYDYLLRYKLEMELEYRYASKISSLDLEHLEDPEIHNLITKVANSFAVDIPNNIRDIHRFFRESIAIIAIGVVLIPFNFWIPVILLLTLVPHIYFKAQNSDFIWLIYASNAPEAKQMRYIGDLLKQTPSILEGRVFQSRNALLKKLKNLQYTLFSKARKPFDRYRRIIFSTSLFEGLIAFGLVLWLIPDALNGAISIGTITFLITAIEEFRANTSLIATIIGEVYQQLFFVEPFFELMNLPTLVQEKADAKPIKQDIPASIEFKNVSFSYPNGKSVLNNISFTINPGESVALVGVNGAGKTTLIKLLCRFYDVTNGEILVNGTNIKDIKLSDWYAQIGTLFQDFVQYNLTVRDNILLGASDIIDEKRMENAAIQSGASEFINKFSKKYDQMLGREFENGEGLSGGQWQKLAIARALYEQSKILIMDEPTSAIDAEAEYEIFQNLEKIYKDRTLILVSHRFSTVRNASKIIVLDGGEIIEMGSHQELLSQKGKYAKMFNTQAQGYK